MTWLHPDHLGSPVAGTNSAGSVIWRESEQPFGEDWVSAPVNDNQAGYTGHIEDAATGLVYMQARYYDPVIGRFLSIDPVAFSVERPDMFNRYAYVANDPVNATDPTGMQMYPHDEGGSIMDYFIDKMMEKAAPAAANSAVTALNETIEAAGTVMTGQDCCIPDIPAPFPDTDPTIQGATDAVIVSAVQIAAARVSAGRMRPSAASTKWQLGSNHSATKWSNQMESRGWTNSQIDEAITSGQQFSATNLVNRGNSATRYVHPETGRSVVRDDVTGDVIHIGGDWFKYD